MANIFFTEPLDRLAPLFKDWVKEAIYELIPALLEIQNPIPKEENLPEYLSPVETAELLGVSLPTLRKYTLAGMYTAYRIGKRKIQYKRSEIEQVLHKRRVDSLAKKVISSSNKNEG